MLQLQVPSTSVKQLLEMIRVFITTVKLLVSPRDLMDSILMNLESLLIHALMLVVISIHLTKIIQVQKLLMKIDIEVLMEILLLMLVASQTFGLKLMELVFNQMRLTTSLIDQLLFMLMKMILV